MWIKDLIGPSSLKDSSINLSQHFAYNQTLLMALRPKMRIRLIIKVDAKVH